MKVVSVNVASVAGEISAAAKRKVKTGIYKKPQSRRVQVDLKVSKEILSVIVSIMVAKIRLFTPIVQRIMRFGVDH